MAAPILLAPGIFAFFLQEAIHAHKILIFLGGGGILVFLGGGGGQFHFSGRKDFSGKEASSAPTRGRVCHWRFLSFRLDVTWSNPAPLTRSAATANSRRMAPWRRNPKRAGNRGRLRLLLGNWRSQRVPKAPDFPFHVFFWISLPFSLSFLNFLAFLSVFSLPSHGFKGFRGDKNPCSLAFAKKARKEDP